MKEPFGLDPDPDRFVTHCSDIRIELPVGGVGEVEIAAAESFHQLGCVVVQRCDTFDSYPIDGLGDFGAHQDGDLRRSLQASQQRKLGLERDMLTLQSELRAVEADIVQQEASTESLRATYSFRP